MFHRKVWHNLAQTMRDHLLWGPLCQRSPSTPRDAPKPSEIGGVGGGVLGGPGGPGGAVSGVWGAVSGVLAKLAKLAETGPRDRKKVPPEGSIFRGFGGVLGPVWGGLGASFGVWGGSFGVFPDLAKFGQIWPKLPELTNSARGPIVDNSRPSGDRHARRMSN